jgi:cellulose synthase/poly-beta-1,6-N-acetylglucosamine synthase-like glycosyltransferase
MLNISLNIFVLSLVGYFTIGLILFIAVTRKEKTRLQKNDNPSVSVIVAVRNEERNIWELLKALAGQNYQRYEVIIVDDGSKDRTLERAQEFCRRQSNFKVIRSIANINNWGPKKNAIHTGIMQSQGEIILTTDADCRPGKGWIRSLVSCFTEDVGAVVGYSPLKFSAGIRGRLKSLESLATAVLAFAFVQLGYPLIAMGRNFAYRKDLYFKLGGFGLKGKIPAGDDDLLLQSLARASKVVVAWEAEVIVPSFESARGYLQRKRRHIAVTRHYPLSIIALGLMVFLFFLSSVFLMFYAIIGEIRPMIFLFCGIFLKCILDYTILSVGAKKLQDGFKIFDFILAEILHSPYTLVLQPLSFVGKIRWRGRKL